MKKTGKASLTLLAPSIMVTLRIMLKEAYLILLTEDKKQNKKYLNQDIIMKLLSLNYLSLRRKLNKNSLIQE